jgi:hypothetical protein
VVENMLCLQSVFCGSTSRITDGGAMKCGGKYALLAKCILQLYFMDYRWRCREVWWKICFACKVYFAALLQGLQMAVP